jgi:hypothetical protein
VVERAAFESELAALRLRDKAHTREGDESRRHVGRAYQLDHLPYNSLATSYLFSAAFDGTSPSP